MTTAAPARARFAPRFSLRLLLIAFTAFAIGFPVWYRWPYQESQPAKLKGSVVTTWQRQWGGGRLKHGPESTYENGKLILRTTYRNGILHGPYEAWQRNGFREVGQYVEGKKSGQWRLLDPKGRLHRSAEWRDDRLDGLCLIVGAKGKQRELLFAQGRLIAADGQKVEDRLGDLAASGAIDDPLMADALTELTDIEFVETPLKDAVQFLAEKHEIPILIDPWHTDPLEPLTSQLQGMQLSWAIQILMAPIDHACDYRYGCLWITSAEDVKNWKDPTGVADINPPKGSPLARAWNEPIAVSPINQPLGEVIEQGLIARLDIAVDVSQIRPHNETDPHYPVTGRFDGFPFRHGLGFFLYKAHCRCELRGETLVILPPESP
ncbi:MAG: hypothetical protein L0211_06635 [Planctomycetaceae bacterium]|nr:hypothetical protein [Planctomycetaceae bacterium]